jgi:hypothetical protein
MRTWARIATAGVSIAAGALLAAVGPFFDAIGEEGDAGTTGVVTGIGIAVLATGAATFFLAGARYVTLALLAALFFLAYSGEVADDVLYELISGASFVLIGLLSLSGHRGGRGRRAGRAATPGAQASPGAPSAAPSTPAEGPDGRAPRS